MSEAATAELACARLNMAAIRPRSSHAGASSPAHTQCSSKEQAQQGLRGFLAHMYIHRGAAPPCACIVYGCTCSQSDEAQQIFQPRFTTSMPAAQVADPLSEPQAVTLQGTCCHKVNRRCWHHLAVLCSAWTRPTAAWQSGTPRFKTTRS